MKAQRNIFIWDGRSENNIVIPGLYVIILKVSGEETVIKSKRVGIKW